MRALRSQSCYFQFYFPGFDDDGSEFHEHIFLDKYLEGFPKQGPIRNFMELVTNGLSKNPYLSVKQKVEHIEWFKKYFNEKRDILKENNIAFTWHHEENFYLNFWRCVL